MAPRPGIEVFGYINITAPYAREGARRRNDHQRYRCGRRKIRHQLSAALPAMPR
jgi:hypothetical protein